MMDIGWFAMIRMKSKLKLAVLGGLVLSFASIIFHAFLAKSSANLVQYSAMSSFMEDLNYLDNPSKTGPGYRRLWGKVKVLEPLLPYVNPRISQYHVPNEQSNGFIYAKVNGGFENIRNSICDLVLVARILNATLVIPEIQQSTHSKGVSSNFKSFSYLYNEEKFISALASDVIIVKNLPANLKEGIKRKHPIFTPKNSASVEFYLEKVLPKLKHSMVVGLVLTDGGCLQSNLPSGLVEYQRLRCRAAFQALHFCAEIIEVSHQIVKRLRGSGQQPYIAYHPGLKRETLAYHGCAELFQDVHAELIRYRRAQMIKQKILNEDLIVDSYARKGNGSCPLMPEEVGLLLRAMGYPPRTRVYLAGSETFGGQRILVPLHAMYTNLVDRTFLCSKQEMSYMIGPESSIPEVKFESVPAKSGKQQKEEWDKAGPRPRPLPPPPDRPTYPHEKEGWYGWIGEKVKEPDPSKNDIRDQAHHLISDAVDYIVSLEADAFFPGFDNDGSRWPDFSSLVMGHRLYKMSSSITYRPDRKYLARLFTSTSFNRYHPPRNWTLSVREHLNKSIGHDGLMREFQQSRTNSTYLSHPLPECLCTTTRKDNILQSRFDECPKGLNKV